MTIEFCTLSSGSSGNCHYVGTDKTKILIDAGFSGVHIERLLTSINVDINTIDYILITHEHRDHIKGAGVLSRRYNIPIIANENTWLAMEASIGNIRDENIKIISSNKDFNLDYLDIQPFRIYHDAREPLGYIIYYKGFKISVVTDTGIVDNNIKNKIKGSNLYFIEANHDIQMLKGGSYPYFLKERVLSQKGHLSNIATGQVLSQVLKGKKEIVVLGHLSRENNTPDLAYRTVKNILGELYNNIHLNLSHRNKPTAVYTLY